MRFVHADPQALARWKSLKEKPFKGLTGQKVHDELVTFHGTPLFKNLTQGQKEALFYRGLQFTAEFFIVLEALIVVAYKRIYKSSSLADRVAGEELYHSRAFRRFLKEEKKLDWPTQTFFLKKHRLVHGLAIRVVRWAPLSMALPGAKIEAYSVYYAKLLKSLYKENDANYWMELNWLHYLDEGQHVGFEFDIYNEIFPQLSLIEKFKVFVGVVLFYCYLQWILSTGSWKVVSTSLKDLGFFKKVQYFIAALIWYSNVFPPAQQMRASIREFRAKKNPPLSRLMWFIWR